MIIPIVPQFFAFWLFFIPFYFLVGFPNDAEQFFYFAFILVFLNMAAYYLAMLIAAITKNEKAALGIFPLLFLFMSTFSGYSIPITAVPKFWTFGPYVSMMRWAFQGLMINFYASFNTDDDASYSSGNGNILKHYSFNGFNKSYSFPIIAVYIVFNSLVTLYFMQGTTKRTVKVTDASNGVPKDKQNIPVSETKSDEQKPKTISLASIYESVPVIADVVYKVTFSQLLL